MATKNAAPAPTLDQVRALLARMEAEQAEASNLGPTAQFCADLDDHRVDPRALAEFVRRSASALKSLGVDLDELDQDDEPDAPADAPPAPADAPPAPVEPTPAGPAGEKGKK